MKRRYLVIGLILISVFVFLTAAYVQVTSPGYDQEYVTLSPRMTYPLHLDVNASATTGTCTAQALAFLPVSQQQWSLTSANEGSKSATHNIDLSGEKEDDLFISIRASISITSDCTGYSGFASVYILE